MSQSKIIRVFRTRELLLVLIQLIALTALYGWLSGKITLASYASKYIPIAPANIALLIGLSSIFLIKLNSGEKRYVSAAMDTLVLILAIFCLTIFLEYYFRLTWDIEDAFLKDPKQMGEILIGRMSPITSLVYIFICIGILGTNQKNPSYIKYLGSSLSLLSFMISSVLLIGYLYRAPLLYGSKIIPVSLPAVICFCLFSITLLRSYESKFLNLNLIKENKVTRLLIRSFLPVVVFIIILQGILITNFPIIKDNLTLSVAIGLFIMIIVTIAILFRISAIIGTQLLNAEQLLKESDTKYRMIVNYNYDWEFWLTNENKFKYNSPSCERISGYKPQDFAENPDLITEIMHPDDLDIYKNHFSPLGKNESCDGIDFRIITNLGEVRWINHVCQPVYDDHGIHIGRRGSNCDITRRKNAEDLILKLNTELKELNLSKDRFVAILGHDLISSFNILLGMSDVLVNKIDKLESGRIQKFAVGINKTAISTYKLLEDILMWAKAQQGNFPFEPQKLNLEDVCRQTINPLISNADVKKIRIDISKTEQISIFADIHMIKTILRNLILNAIKFTNKGGLISLSAEQNHAKITITVSDNGVGIKPENLARLFDITQVITTKGTANEEGNGLGLILCKDFVEKHGGNIWAESNFGHGSKFRFTLPIE